LKKKLSILFALVLAVSLMVIPAATASAEDLLEGSFVCEQDGWLFVHLEGTPYQVGYQNGYLAAESANYWLISYVGTEGAEDERATAEVIWPLIPEEYQDEIDGIVAGLHARGYTNWDRWDVVAANAWADMGTYEGGCSAFAATGDATTDGQIVLGHITMSGKAGDFMYYVMFDVTPDEGYRFRYQSAGASMWSGQDWYLNETGLIVAETSLHNSVRDPSGTPLFVRIRQALQYADSIDGVIDTLLQNNNGAYPNEWLIGDAKTGEICSLMLGCNAWDINRTFNGFYPSCNYPYYENFRIEAGYDWPAPDPPTSTRAVRWIELIDQYYGEIDVEVGKLFFEDDIISSYGLTARSGGYDGKVSSTDMVLDDMSMWARWGNPAGKPFDLEAYVEERGPEWEAANPEYIANLGRYVERTPQPWTILMEEGYQDRVNTAVELIAGVLPAIISIDAAPASLDFGMLVAGDTSAEKLITVQNTGSVDVEVTGTSTTIFWERSLFLDATLLGNWSVNIERSTAGGVSAEVRVPSDWTPGIETGLLILWAEMA